MSAIAQSRLIMRRLLFCLPFGIATSIIIYWNCPLWYVVFFAPVALGFAFLLDPKTFRSSFERQNARRMLCVLLAATVFVSLVFPYVARADSIRKLISATAIQPFVGLSAILFLLLIFSWDSARVLWERYRNSWELENPTLLAPDFIALFFFFSILMILALQRHWLPMPSLQFLAFAALNATLTLGWFLTSFHWHENTSPELPSNVDLYAVSDAPIESLEQDLLGRGEFVEALYNEIINLTFSDSFVFGLYGTWGEGKTSVINLLTSKLKTNDAVLAVDIDPWYFKGDDSILIGSTRS